MRHPLLDAHPLFPLLAEDLSRRPGALAEDEGNPARAAVAVVLRAPAPAGSGPRPGMELLLIQRATREGDPWSGQVALPGGRNDPADATLQDTAVRETREETGIDLGIDGLILGTLDELRPRTPVLPPIIVTPFVALVSPQVRLTTSHEVADAFWVPWSTFADPDAVNESEVDVRGASWRVSSYVIGSRIVWGMTERMLRALALRIRSLPIG